MTAQKSLYESDFYAWCNKQANFLRQNELCNLDLLNLTEEIESMGRREKSELINRLSIAIAHILKCIYQPERLSKSWIYTIDEQFDKIKYLIEDNPTLKPLLEQCKEKAYKYSRLQAARETGINIENFPEKLTEEINQIIKEHQ